MVAVLLPCNVETDKMDVLSWMHPCVVVVVDVIVVTVLIVLILMQVIG